MATQVQLRRGTSSENDSFTGAQGELTFDTTNKRVRVHDGATAGGFELKTENSSGNTLFADNEKAIFGAGSDLQIYHDGSNNRSYITESGSGAFVIQGENLILEETGGNNYIQATAGGAVQVYHNGSEKLATTSTGVDITGTLTSDGLTVAQSNPVITITDTDGSTTTTLKTLGSNTELSNTTGGNLRFRTSVSELERMRISPDGDISFYEDTGTTPKFFWDASAESLGIGTSSPSKSLTISSSTPAIRLEDTDQSVEVELTNFEGDGILSTNGASNLKFQTNNTERMRIDSSGNVGIGVTPSSTNYGDWLFIGSAGNSIFGASNDMNMTANAYYNTNWTYGTSTAASRYQQSSGQHIWSYAASGTAGNTISFNEAMRIDASGNLLVGTTSSNSRRFQVKSPSNQPAASFYRPRNTAGGGLIAGYSDVGGTEAQQFSFTTDGELYLNGAIYLNGDTAAANALDDYEEGTWTPTFTSTGTDPTVTYGTRHASYRKVGSMVTVWIDMTVSSYTGGTGNGTIGSFPFSQSGSARGVISGRSTSGITYDKGFQIELIGGIGYFSEDALGDLPLSDFSTGGFRIIISGSYTTA